MSLKNTFKKILLAVGALFILHIIILTGFYFFQETVIFRQQKLASDYKFVFNQPFEEVFINANDGSSLHGLHFHVDKPTGVVLFFHGNGGTLKQWGHDASLYLKNNYDVLFIDYRGYGKSGGKIQNEKQLIDDAQAVYNHLKSRYDEGHIVVIGLSMGSGIATQLAAKNHPAKLILMAPYYGLQELITEKAFVVPQRLVRYKLQSHQYLDDVKCPIAIIHGVEDNLIPIQHSERLKAHKSNIHLYNLADCGHMVTHCGQEFERSLRTILSK